MTALLLLLTAPLVDPLGHPAFAARDRADARLRSLGWWGLPAVCRGLSHPSPEVRYRCRRMHDWLAARPPGPAWGRAQVEALPMPMPGKP